MALSTVGSVAADPASSSEQWRDVPTAAQAAAWQALGRGDERFHAQQVAGSLQLADPLGRLTASFDRRGLHLQTTGGADVRLALQAMGYGEALRPMPRVAPHASANRCRSATCP